MAKKRPSPVALVQSYFAEGPGAESASLLAAVASKGSETASSPLVATDRFEQAAINHDSHPSILVLHQKNNDDSCYQSSTPIVKPVTSAPNFETKQETISDRLIPDSLILNGQTVKPSNQFTDTPSDSVTALHLDSHTALQSHSGTATQSNSQTVKQSKPDTVYTVSTASHETVEAPASTYETVSYQTHYQTIPLDVLTLPYNQACVLEYLINAGGITNARAISEATHIGIPSVRDAISRLIRRGFMPEPITVRNAAFQGFSYILNQTMVKHFMAAGGLEQKTYKQASDRLILDRQTVSAPNRTTVLQSHGETEHSSSSLIKQTTTPSSHTLQPSHSQSATPFNGMAIKPSDMTPSADQQNFILTGSAGIFWEGEGLQERQAKTWCDQFEIEPSLLKQQLEWARHDLVVNNKAAEVKKDSISWFFGVLRQTGGCYPKPSNYKSPTEIRAEQMEQAAKEATEARERQIAAEREIAFQKILSEETGDSYKSLLAKVNDFAKEMGGKVLETALRDAFMNK